ncbi:hypothetical protein SARC_00970 [Sphaeroforma arctica JP610]|uniref:Uncharacterized protein n=1 Tax=Sphaeroforma arctica JP610 TaxID=667725 RepID=A0A0L0GCY0_9EUKA|nr:hypothetical protein SARC_00970 [Sphaeroforma arctica JP610]KNC86875.1 hypothetical protein SARC_00970 [Sphaeroforma arctica JP610]|eukprot:XP_014160777.1 hypothetical protein SARC_00970 [Sphaeroforma arctica JP610]
MTKKDNTPAKKRKAERKKIEREAASAAAATAAAEAIADAADGFNRTVAEALVSGNNSQNNASDKDVATPIKETTPAERARGPMIASISKYAFPKRRSETRDTSHDAPTNSSDETQTEKFPIIRDKDESQKVLHRNQKRRQAQVANPNLRPRPLSQRAYNQLAALMKSMSVEYVDRTYESGKQAQRLREHVSPGITKALQKWTERQQSMSPEKRMDLSAKPVSVDPYVLSVSIPYEDLPPEVQANYSAVLSPGHESPVLEGIIDPEAGKNTPPPLPSWGDRPRHKPVKTGYVVHTELPPELIRPTPIPGTEHRKASTMDFTRGNKHPSRRDNDVEFNRFDRTVIHQPVEDFHFDEVTKLNKAVDVYTKKMEIADTNHQTDDVLYFANMIAIKQKRIDQLLHAQRGQVHRDNQKYKRQISRLKSNWDANSKQIEL